MTTSTRRERIRTETLQEIKNAALAQIATDGAPGLSIRAVARAIGMSPAGLYRYYDGRDALLTDLITDAYASLAEAVETAVAADEHRSTGERFRAGLSAYRRWAIREPNRFLLIFGTPVPGYAAPEGGPTVDANRRMGEAFFQLAVEGWLKGELATPPGEHRPSRGEQELLDQLRTAAPDLPAGIVPKLMAAWATWHGLVSLEVTNQFDWLYDDLDDFMESRFDAIADSLGLADATS